MIIEYKRDKSFSVIDQGYAYLALMLNNKADFILEYNEKTKNNLKRDDVDWSQSRVLFVANSFTTYQRNAINFKDLPIELWEAKKYSNETILFNHLRSSEARESIKAISKNKTIASVSKEVKKYSVDDHFKGKKKYLREAYDNLVEKMVAEFGDLIISPVKSYIGIRIQEKSNFIVVWIKKDNLQVELLRVQPKDLNDPQKKTRYKNKSFEYYHVHISLVDIQNDDDLDYAMFLVKQVYNKFYK